jgi:protein subunit release factor B
MIIKKILFGSLHPLNKLMFYTQLRYFSNNFNNNKKDSSLNKENNLTKMIEDKDNVIRKPIKSSGPGGQHVNKTQSAIFLQDKKTDISVKVGNSRDSVVNSGIAKKRLIDKLDFHYNGAESKLAKKIEKIKKQKERNRRKSENKHNLDKDPNL